MPAAWRLGVAGPDPHGVTAWRCWSAGCVGLEDRGDMLLVTFPAEADARQAVEDLADLVIAGPEPVDLVAPGRERAPATPVRAGPFVVRPPWVELDEVGAGEHDLVVDPGTAFGSGSHPSTRLALELLALVSGPGRAVLDLGCGSGVLTVAAARLGAAVVAVDLDREARRVTAANVARNGPLPGSVCVDERPLAELDDHFDVVVANLTIDQQEAVAPELRAHLAPTGRLVAAGILAGDQEHRLAAAHPALEVGHRRREGEWVGLVLGPTGPD